MAYPGKFPDYLPGLNESVADIAWAQDLYTNSWSEDGEAAEPDSRFSADVFITLNSGKAYRITVNTPTHIKNHMDQGGAKSYFEEGLILVSEVTWDCIFDAIERLLEDDFYGLEFYALSEKWQA